MAMENTEKIIFSIIIPHYNLPDKLDRLLSSIPLREDLEIIVVDDCSSNQLDLLEIVKEKYPRVSFYSTTQNGGGGKARNLGIRKAKGKYIIFADADDFFLSSLNDFLNEYTSEEVDLVFFNALSLDEGSYLPAQRNLFLTHHFSESERKKDPNGLYFRYLFGEPWCKLIRKELIIENNIRFDEISIHNDTTFSYLIGYHAKNIIFDPITVYCIINRPNSVSKQLDSSKIELRLKTFAKKNKFFKDKNIPVFDPLILQPFTASVKKRKFSQLKYYHSLIKQEGLDWKDLVKGIILYKMKLR